MLLAAIQNFFAALFRFAGWALLSAKAERRALARVRSSALILI